MTDHADIKLYKSLSADGRSCNGGHSKWSLPTLQPDGTYKPGRWMPRIEGLIPCKRGYHLFERKDLLRWVNETLYEAEYRGAFIDRGDKYVVESARLVRPLPGCNERTLRLFACRVAEDVLPAWEAKHHDDARPRETIEVARRYANGEATVEELRAAQSAADSAADSTADSAARLAAYSTADSAADSAADWAARSAAYWAAQSAARSAARLAAQSAARRAADSAARRAADSAAYWAAYWTARSRYTDWLWEMMEADAR